MNLRLEVFKINFIGDYTQGRHIRFAVVDLDKSKNYPANFVCLLPKAPSVTGKANNKFSKIFEKSSLELAKRLLTEALKTERDSEVKKEIEHRLNLLKTQDSKK